MPVYILGGRASCYVVTNRRCMVWYGGPFSSKEDYLPGTLTNHATTAGSAAATLATRLRSVTTITHSVNRGRVSSSRSTTYYGFLNAEPSEVERISGETLRTAGNADREAGAASATNTPISSSSQPAGDAIANALVAVDGSPDATQSVGRQPRSRRA